jgi:acetyl-CoA acetyltransferase
VGATGAYQLAEMAQILRGDFGGRPHEPWTTGVTVNVGGTATAATVNVLRRES